MAVMAPGAPSWVLVINAAEGVLQFVLARREVGPDMEKSPLVPVCAQSWRAPSQGAELLAPALRDALTRLRLGPGDMDGIACVRGPGSFTGLRLAIATAAGLARAWGAPQAGLSYMPLLADNARALTGDILKQPCRIWVLTHARRQLVHMQGFVVGQSMAEGPEPVTGILVVSSAEAAEIAASRFDDRGEGTLTLLLGSGLSRNRDFLEGAFRSLDRQDILLLPSAYDHPSFQALTRAAGSAEYTSKDIAPLYARPSDAEENLESIAASLGLDPVAAREKLDRIKGAAE